MKHFYTFLAAVLFTATTFAQVGINTETPDASAALDITSTTGGLLMPRMTNAQRLNISEPAVGLQVFVTDFAGGSFMFYDGSEWKELSLIQLRTLPDAPTIGAAGPGNGEATVSFTAPSNDGGSAITSYTATSSPDDISATVTQAGSGDITVTGLTNETAYTFTVTATNSIGTSVASAASNSVTPIIAAIGVFYRGGVIFHLFEEGEIGYVVGETHGLVAAPSDQSSAEWGCYGQSIGGTSSAFGSGAANTTAIVSGCSESGIAAKICEDLTLNGYSDWFLPSRVELNLMYLNIGQGSNLENIGGFSNDVSYFSSSEHNSNRSWAQYFGNGGQFDSNKYNTFAVRAVRAF